MTQDKALTSEREALVALFIEIYGEHPAASFHRFNDFCDGYRAALAASSASPDRRTEDEPSKAESVAACLRDDAAKLREEGGWAGEEVADNMEEAATLLDDTFADYMRLLREKQDRASSASPDDFDRWQANPYTKVLQKSFAEDYVPRSSASPEQSAVAALREALKRYLDQYEGVFDCVDNHGKQYQSQAAANAEAAARAALSAAPVSPPEPNAVQDHPAGTGGNAHALSGLPSAAPGVPRRWMPQFDAASSKQELLARQFCAEIAGQAGWRGSPPDPVRLLEMAEALYLAEMGPAQPVFHLRSYGDVSEKELEAHAALAVQPQQPQQDQSEPSIRAVAPPVDDLSTLRGELLINAMPPTCGNGCACLTQCGDYYDNAGLPKPAALDLHASLCSSIQTDMLRDAVREVKRIAEDFSIGSRSLHKKRALFGAIDRLAALAVPRASDRNPQGGDADAAPGRSPESAVRRTRPEDRADQPIKSGETP